MTAFAQVINARMADDGASNDGVGTVEHEQIVGHGHRGFAIITGLDVAHVAMVTLLFPGTAVGLALGVPMRSSGSASIAQVSCSKAALVRKCPNVFLYHDLPN